MALRISRRVCTLGRPRALGAGTKGSMWNHSASDKSVWYALLMLGTLPSHYLRTPFRTVSEGSFSETQFPAIRVLGNLVLFCVAYSARITQIAATQGYLYRGGR